MGSNNMFFGAGGKGHSSFEIRKKTRKWIATWGVSRISSRKNVEMKIEARAEMAQNVTKVSINCITVIVRTSFHRREGSSIFGYIVGLFG